MDRLRITGMSLSINISSFVNLHLDDDDDEWSPEFYNWAFNYNRGDDAHGPYRVRPNTTSTDLPVTQH